jgi:hypothetical protein
MYFATFLLKTSRARPIAADDPRHRRAIGTVVTLRGRLTAWNGPSAPLWSAGSTWSVAAGIPDQLRSNLDEAIGTQIERIAGVRRVSSGLLELVDIQRGGSNISILVNGWRPGGAQLDELAIVSGRAIRPEDSRAIMLGATLAEHLHKGVGDPSLEGKRPRRRRRLSSFDLENGGVVPSPRSSADGPAQSVTGFTVG